MRPVIVCRFLPRPYPSGVVVGRRRVYYTSVVVHEIIFPLVAVGVFLAGLLAFGMLAGGRRDRRLYWSVFLLLAVSLLTVGLDALVLVFGILGFDHSGIAPISRIHELSASAYMVAIPFFLSAVLPPNSGERLAARILWIVAGGLLVVFVGLAYSGNAAFLSLTPGLGEPVVTPYSSVVGRVTTGPLFMLRDVTVGAALVASLVIAIVAAVRGRMTGSRRLILAGMIIGVVVGAGEIYANLAGSYLWPFNVVPLSPIILGSMIFTITATSDYVLQYSQQALELKITNVELRDRNDRLGFLAYHNDLTGLPNRSALVRDIDTLFAATDDTAGSAGGEQSLGEVFLCDLDSFGSVQDSYGFGFAEKILRAVSDRIHRLLAGFDLDDAGVYQVDGDRFAVLVREGLTDHRREDLERGLGDAISAPLAVDDGQEVYLSAGIAECPLSPEAADAETIIQRLKLALTDTSATYKVVRRYSPEIHSRLEENRRMIQDLRRAIREAEFDVHYQPIVDRAGRVSSGEALVRWSGAPPGRFIPLAEQSGLIIPITEFVIDHVCSDIAALRHVFPDLVTHVNISARHIMALDFPRILTDHLSARGLSPACLGVEITETSFLQESPHITRTLGAIREAGFSVSIDDFGTGHASLSYLKQIPAERLKIDASFVRGLPESRDDRALVNSMILLADSLDKQIVAEGVERTDQRDYLVDQGAAYLQGYLFARPSPPEDFGRDILAS